MQANVLYAQSGGVTAVINATAAGVIEACRKHPETFGKVYAGLSGIIGVLEQQLYDTSVFTDAEVARLKQTPGGFFRSCRHNLKWPQHEADFHKILACFKAYNIRYFFYNGGNDSQDTTHQLAEFCAREGYAVQCIGIPKTIDNDLPITDNCPGFGSVAKYVGIATLEASMDIASMCKTSTKVFILEVMGRHAGWIAGSAGLAQRHDKDAPHIILLPEVPFDSERFLAKVQSTVDEQGYCVVVASEGLQHADGTFISASGHKDAFGHAQLGGVAPYLANHLQTQLKLKCHWAVADYLQRSARHIASQVDLEQAIAVGTAAVEFSLAGKNGVMPVICRIQDNPYRWKIGEAPLVAIANQERKMPADFIREDGFGITEKAKAYFRPLIQGEAYPAYKDGLPDYWTLPKQ